MSCRNVVCRVCVVYVENDCCVSDLMSVKKHCRVCVVSVSCVVCRVQLSCSFVRQTGPFRTLPDGRFCREC
jgi:hypothetical protein